MNEERNKKKVYDEMRKEMRKDRAKSSVLPLTEFGLMQITRQRIRRSIAQSLSETCPVCGGTGILVSKMTIVRQIERWLERYRTTSRERSVVLRVHPTLGDLLGKGLFSPIRKLEMKHLMRIKLEPDESLTGDEFRFFSNKQQKDVTAEFSAAGALPVEVIDTEEEDETSIETEDMDERSPDERLSRSYIDDDLDEVESASYEQDRSSTIPKLRERNQRSEPRSGNRNGRPRGRR
jgi:hypothetical protein